jgi:hypothetical protein
MNGLISLRRTAALTATAGAVAAVTVLAGAAGSGAAPAAHTSAASLLPACRTVDLAAALRGQQAGAGQRYATLVLRNRSKRSCHTFGYVGLQLRAKNGANLPTRTERDRSPAPKRVVLAPGGHAFAKLQWGAIPDASEPQRYPCEPTARRLQVTPPDQTTRLTLSWRGGPVCSRGWFRVGALTR